MQKMICRLIAVLLSLTSLASNAATELQQYVQQCQNELHFNAGDVQAIEPVVNTEYVRVHNVPTNVYLTVTSTAEQATVNTAASNTSTNEIWTVETVSGSSNFRLKNLFSGKYLTIADPKNFTSTPDYLPIYSQGLNTGWTSQHWTIN